MMSRQEYVDLLFEQTEVLARALPHLEALAGCVEGANPMNRAAREAHVTGLEDLGYTYRPKRQEMVEGVIPRAEPHEDLKEIALRAIDGFDAAQAQVCDAWDGFREACEKMGLPVTPANAAQAYLARQLNRLAEEEKALGIVEGPASRLISHPTELAERARAFKIDTGTLSGGPDRWRKRFARHPAT